MTGGWKEWQQKLVAATRGGKPPRPAANRTGSIRKGMDADLLLVDGNPLEDIAAIERISLVVLKGERIRRGQLFDQKQRRPSDQGAGAG